MRANQRAGIITPSFQKSFITPMRQTLTQAPAINTTARNAQLDIFPKSKDKTEQSPRSRFTPRSSSAPSPPSSPASDHHVARGWIKSEARRAGSALLRAGCRHAGLPCGARADPLRPVFSGAAESVSSGGARLRRGAA